MYVFTFTIYFYYFRTPPYKWSANEATSLTFNFTHTVGVTYIWKLLFILPTSRHYTPSPRCSSPPHPLFSTANDIKIQSFINKTKPTQTNCNQLADQDSRGDNVPTYFPSAVTPNSIQRNSNTISKKYKHTHTHMISHPVSRNRH